MLATLLIAALALTGCTRSPEDTMRDAEELQQLADEKIGGLSGVLAVAADLETGVNVTVVETVQADELASIAEVTRSFVDENRHDAAWWARISMEIVDRVPEDDMSAQTRLSIEVYPTVAMSVAADALAAMSMLTIPGVESVVVMGGLPFVTVTSASTLEPTMDALGGMDLWAAGGTLWAEAGRVRLRDVPDRLTAIGVSSIIQLSVSYSTGQFWLEAPLAGPHWPRLYIDEVATEEAAAIASVLQNPGLPAMTTIDGYLIDFNIRVIGPDGTTDTWGAIGVAPGV